jgi:hypothetical protein
VTHDVEHRWAVDSIENGVARIEEDGKDMISVPLRLLPEGVTEGQLLRVIRGPGNAQDAAIISIAIDAEATLEAMAKSKATMTGAMRASKKLDKGGDVSL